MYCKVHLSSTVVCAADNYGYIDIRDIPFAFLEYDAVTKVYTFERKDKKYTYTLEIIVGIDFNNYAEYMSDPDKHSEYWSSGQELIDIWLEH